MTARMITRSILLLGAATISFASASAAQAADAATKQYSIPAADAGSAIQQLARDAGVQVMAPTEHVRGVRTKPVRGTYTASEALALMLEGTGLEAVSSNGTLIVRRAAEPPQQIEAPTSSQVDTASDETIVVTGSRIRRAGFDTLESATTTDAAEISRRGYTNVLDALQNMPGFGPAASSALQSSQSQLGIAQSFSNFFNLGSQRTLTLVNGRRFVSSNTVSGAGGATSPGSQVDLNMIPVGLTERVETIAIGGAPVYGSDAISGTVNIILKDNFEGLQLSGQAGVSSRGDAANQTVRALAGKNFAGGRGNIVFGAEYTRQEGMRLTGRFPFRYLFPSDPASNNGSAQMVVDDLHYIALTDGGLPFLTTSSIPGASNYIRDAAGNAVVFDQSGNLVPFNTGSSFYGSNISGFPVYASGGDGVDLGRYNAQLLSPNERYLFNLIGHFDLTDGITAFVEGSYAHTSGTKITDLFQFSAPGLLGGPLVTLNVNNPFLSNQARGILTANGVTTFNLNRNYNDIVDRRPAKSEIEVYRIVAGLRGDFSVGGERWNWDVSYNYGRSRNRSEFNQINRARFMEAVNVVGTAANPVCASGNAACVPLNLFGEFAPSDAAVNYVIDQGIGISTNELEDFQANLGGSLGFGLAAPISFSLGYEHRRESGEFQGNDILNTGLTLLGVGQLAYPDAPRRGYNTDEFYGELVVPLISDAMGLPLVRSLEVEGKLRHVDHSVSGSDLTWAAGGRIETRLPGLALRGVYTRSIRAPSLVELYLNTTPTLRNPADVCDKSRVNAGPNPAVRLANCTAALAAVGAPTPANFTATTTSVTPAGTVGGNPNLSNEVAKSYSFGVVYQPPGTNLRVSIDYSRIKLDNAISRFTLPQAESACYDSPAYPNEGACQAFSRLNAAQAAAQAAATGRPRVAGDIADGYLESYYNSQSLLFSGIIGQINYDMRAGNLLGGDEGRLRFGLGVLYIDKFDSQTSGAAPVVQQAGTLGNPRWDVTGSIGYDFSPLSLDVQVLWTDKTVGSRTATFAQTPVNDYPAHTRVNTTLGVDINDRFGLNFIVRNLFDAKVPYAATVTRSFSVYDPIGRSFMAQARVKF